MPGDGRLRLPFCRKINGKRSSRSAGAPFPFRAPDKRSPEAFPVRAKGSRLPLIKTLRALNISFAGISLSHYARRHNLKARAQLHFRANAGIRSRALPISLCRARQGKTLPLNQSLRALRIWGRSCKADQLQTNMRGAVICRRELSSTSARRQKAEIGGDLAPEQLQPMV